MCDLSFGEWHLRNNAQEHVYDACGNPTTYRGKTVTWSRGRKMTRYGSNTFAYNGQGDYGGEFVNAGGSVGGIGFEVCGAPCPSDDSTFAVCTTFSFPCSPTDEEAHAGYDYYQSCWYWDIDG